MTCKTGKRQASVNGEYQNAMRIGMMAGRLSGTTAGPPTFEGRRMKRFKFTAAVLLGACSLAAAQDVVLTGRVQRVILQPSGTEDCPRPCPVVAPVVNGMQRVCISNQGGCQTMEIKVDKVYRGEAAGPTRQFRSRIGEWGPTFPVTEKPIVVSEAGGKVFWSIATLRDGKIFVDPRRLRTHGGVPTQPVTEGELVALDEVLAQSGGR